ncbi:response regulator [Blastopirellula retiformator]|uniref:Transcriptional regulatory protein BaeR n=1 Tax=Blastopirellula retiformator TaxID=2527970 RepID=A0A5C5VAB4_9BACT|nr:response regulator [Blastopirellula retiformator]TWT34652.1 Transcriptional regulatory protein BaeR [Blastopirellula retiformator]
MLVVTRHSKEKISFPQVGITIHFIRIHSGNVKIGVDAPRDIAIVRDEIESDDSTASLIRRQFLRLPREIRHGIRNELHEISIGLHLYRELQRAGHVDEAEEAFQCIQHSLKRLDENQVFQRSPRRAPTSGNILLVEDVANEREMLADFLRLHGYGVRTFANGQEVLNYLKEATPPKVILVDMKMPDCDGPTTVRQIRSDSRIQTTQIFALSGTSPKENGLESGARGIDRWFPKPVNPQGLINAIEAIGVGKSNSNSEQEAL